jgi:hypothetical protein
MAKITVLEQQFKDNKPSGFKVTLSDGTFGYLVEKDSDKGLIVNDEVTYTSETPTGKSYKKLTIKKVGSAQQGIPTPFSQTTPPPPPPVLTPMPQPSVNPPQLIPSIKSIKEMKHESRLKVLETLGVLASVGKIEPKDIIELFNEFYPALDLSYDVLGK